MNGTLALVRAEYLGSVVTADTLAGETVIPVDDTIDFDEDGGQVSLDGEVYTYVEVVEESLTLADPLTDDVLTDTPAWSVDAAGGLEVEWFADVDLDQGGDIVPASIPTELLGDFPEGTAAAGQLVEMELRGDGYVVRSRPFQSRALDPAVVADPYCFGTLTADTTIPTATWTTLTGWFSFKRDFTTTFVTPGAFFVEKDGIYHVEVGVRWRSNATGRRAVKSIRHTVLGDFDQFTDSRPAEATAAMSTLSTDTVPLHAGDQITFQAYQDSGAGLDTIGGETSFSITRVGAL